MSYASGSIKIIVKPDRITDVQQLIHELTMKYMFDSCWFHVSEMGVSVELTFPVVTNQLLKAIKELHEAAWPGLLDKMEGGEA